MTRHLGQVVGLSLLLAIIPWSALGQEAEGVDHDKVIADSTRAIALNPRNASAYSKRGRAWRAKAEYDKAIADYDKVIALDPNPHGPISTAATP